MFFFIIKQSTFSSLKKYFNANGYDSPYTALYQRQTFNVSNFSIYSYDPIRAWEKPRVNDVCISTGHFMAILFVTVVVTS